MSHVVCSPFNLICNLSCGQLRNSSRISQVSAMRSWTCWATANRLAVPTPQAVRPHNLRLNKMMSKIQRSGTEEQGLGDKHTQVPSHLPKQTRGSVRANLPFQPFSALWQVWGMWTMDQKAMASRKTGGPLHSWGQAVACGTSHAQRKTRCGVWDHCFVVWMDMLQNHDWRVRNSNKPTAFQMEFCNCQHPGRTPMHSRRTGCQEAACTCTHSEENLVQETRIKHSQCPNRQMTQTTSC